MTDKQLSSLTDGGDPAAGDIAYVVRGGNSRRVDLGDFLDDLDTAAGVGSTAELVAAIADTQRSIRMRQDFTLTESVTLPFGCRFNLNGFLLTKGFNGDMIVLTDQAQVLNGRIDGEGGTYTGRAITITSGNNQRLVNLDIADTESYNLEIAANTGLNFAWIGGSFNRTTAASDAIKLPDSELSTSGVRRFICLAGNGSAMIDLAGGNVTYITNCAAASITFQDASRYAIIDGSRIAQSPTIKGTLHNINALWSGNITLASGTTYTKIFEAEGFTVTDSSGSTTNEINYARHKAVVQMAGADDVTVRTVRGTGDNDRLIERISTQGHWLSATANNQQYRMGVNTADDIILDTGDIQFSLPVTQSLGADNMIAHLLRGAGGNDRAAYGVTSGGVPYLRGRNGASPVFGRDTTDWAGLEDTGTFFIGKAGIRGHLKLYGDTGSINIRPPAAGVTTNVTMPSDSGILVASATAPADNQIPYGQTNGAVVWRAPPSRMKFFATGVDFNSANSDTAVAITLPPGVTRYLVTAARIFGASASLTTATVDVRTASGGGGSSLVLAGPAAMTINTASENTNNNSQTITFSSTNTQSFTVAVTPTIYFRVVTPQGSAATATIMIEAYPLL